MASRKPSDFIAGALAMRELIANQYAQAGYKNHARAILNTWDKKWGNELTQNSNVTQLAAKETGNGKAA